MTIVNKAMVTKAARLTSKAATQPQAEIKEIWPTLGCADHQGRCQAPSAEPAMKKMSVTSMRVLPPPAVSKRAGRTAAAELHAQSEQERADKDGNTDRPIFPMHRLAEKAALREHREEQQYCNRKHHHLRA